MNDFIDLTGASGGRYRFRVWPEGASHLPMAGNFAYVRQEADGFTVLVLGESSNLALARSDWPRAAKAGATHVFTRLNVSRATRTAEHADIAAVHAKARLLESAD
jgi:hypothetical protein